MEARDRQAGDREAFGIAARLIEAHLEDTKHSNGWSIPRLASARVRLERMVTQLRAAAAIEDAPNLNDCIDGTPLPGKCQDKDCPGPHTIFEDEAPVK